MARRNNNQQTWLRYEVFILILTVFHTFLGTAIFIISLTKIVV